MINARARSATRFDERYVRVGAGRSGEGRGGRREGGGEGKRDVEQQIVARAVVCVGRLVGRSVPLPPC